VLFRGRCGHESWRLSGPDGEVQVDARGPLSGDDTNFVREAVLAGAGVGLVPHIFCRANLESRSLVRVLSHFSCRLWNLFVMFPDTPKTPPKVAAFRDLVLELFPPFEAASNASVWPAHS
jgi:DNA-binding transcriptional LysR family regulator